MRVLGSGISADIIDFTKIVRLLRHQLANSDLNEEYKDMIKLILQFSLLPALNCTSSNPGLASEIWDLIKHYTATERYEIYDYWFRIGGSLTCESIYNMCMTVKETLTWCKRLNNEKARESGKMLEKISCNNPLISFDIVLTNLRTYANLIDPSLVALNYCSSLSLDCITFTVLRQMMDYKKDKIEKTGTVSVWLQNIATFTGQFLRKNYSVDLHGIFIYLLSHIKLGQSPEMRLLRDMIMHMSGWISLDMTEMTQNQIECLSGGFLLRIEASEYTDKLRSSKNSENSLKTALNQKVRYVDFEEGVECPEDDYTLAFLYMALVARSSKTLLYNTDTDQLRFLSSRHDELHLLFIQISEFLMFADKTPQLYSEILPTNPLRVLTRTFGLYPEQVFHTIRHSLKPLYELTEEEYATKVLEFKDVLDYYLSQNAL